jgi:iron-sulfur cluster repair protein YtfE (RIC family)
MASTATPARPIPGFTAPAVGFEQPFAMLEACHERVQRTLALLARLRVHVREQGADENARQAARDVLRYFDMAAPLHHEDEELHVFPLLLAHGAPEVVRAVRQLQQDHLAMAASWAAARTPLQALADATCAAFSAEDEVALKRFADRYADHIAMEEGLVYPAAIALLPAEALSAMGDEMAVRRGATRLL